MVIWFDIKSKKICIHRCLVTNSLVNDLDLHFLPSDMFSSRIAYIKYISVVVHSENCSHSVTLCSSPLKAVVVFHPHHSKSMDNLL